MTSNRKNRSAWIARWMFSLLMVCSLTGCNYAILLGYLIGGPPSIEPDMEAAVPGVSFTDKDVTVAVVCYAPTELKWDVDKVDQELSSFVAYRLGQHHIDFVSPTTVQAWLDANRDWDTPQEVGEGLGCSYVVYIDLSRFSLYEEHSQDLYRGRAEAVVSVIKMEDDGEGEKIYTKEITSQFPLRAPRSTTEVSYTTFKRQFMTRLSEEIGRLFYESYAGDDIPDAT